MANQDLEPAAAARVAVLVNKKRAAVVDTVPMPTLSPPRSPIRARDEMCLLILGARKKNCALHM